MVTELKFPFEAWDPRIDVALERPGSVAGLTAVHADVNITDLREGSTIPTVDLRDRNPGQSGVIDGVIGLLAGSLEWLRYNGFSVEDIQSKVRSYNIRHRETPETKARLAEYRALEGVGR